MQEQATATSETEIGRLWSMKNTPSVVRTAPQKAATSNFEDDTVHKYIFGFNSLNNCQNLNML